MSYNAYNPKGEPFTALADTEIAPDAGATNPYRVRAKRTAAKRSYTLQVRGEAQPAGKAPANTLSLGAPDETGRVTGQITYRVYVADRGSDAAGDVGLPTPRLILADGTVLTGKALCDATPSPARGTQRPPLLTGDQWKALTALPFSTLHNRYAFTMLSGRNGKVFAFRAKAPRTPRTFAGAKRTPGGTDMRYFSVCTGGSAASGLTYDCVYDEQVAVDRKGFFTVVVSRPQDRPANARGACGATWVNWGEGDGFAGGRPDYSTVIYRTMLPSPSFKHSVFAVARPGTEERAMGAYFPRGAYTTERAFERHGCAKPAYAPRSR